MSDQFAALLEIIQPLLARGYRAELVVEDGCVDIEAVMGGDCNCPHARHYDPTDGHGYTHVDCVDVVDDVGDDPGTADWARAIVARVERLEGTARGEKDKQA